MRLRSAFAALAGLAVLVLAIGASMPQPQAQPPQPPPPEANGGPGATIEAARRANTALMLQYSWDCRTELITDGKEKDVRIDSVQYGPDGSLQRTQVNNQTFNMPIGFFRRVAADNELKQMEAYLKGLHGLLDQYTMSSAGKISAFLSKASVQPVTAPDGTALLKLQGSGVVMPGDTMAIWASRQTHKMYKVEITTQYEGATARMTATYKTNKAGLNYVSLAQIDVPDKKVTLMVHNYDYVPND